MGTNVLSPIREPASASSAPPAARRTVGQRVWVAVCSAGAAVLGVAPHVLHHVGLLAGALFAGVGGSLLFGAVGLLASIPFLVRVRRRTGTWRMPAVLLAVFAVIFSISTFVIGPAITTAPSGQRAPASEQTVQPTAPGPTEKDIHGH